MKTLICNPETVIALKLERCLYDGIFVSNRNSQKVFIDDAQMAELISFWHQELTAELPPINKEQDV